MVNSSPPTELNIAIRNRVTCPHCWATFAPADTLWIAEHPSLQQDPLLDGEGLRFLPSRFDVEGRAIDAEGAICHQFACPQCHLRTPRPVFELRPLFVSIAGTPSCGKTYFLASMTWKLRHTFPKYFAMTFADADPSCNLLLNQYENEQFFNPDPTAIVKLSKTQEHGDLYNGVMYGDQLVEYPRPFLFSIRPQNGHPNVAQAARIARLLCLYDNAGESFEPGKDNASSPVTRHMAQARVMLFCFDPTQDPRLRSRCADQTSDPQITEKIETRRQEAVFHEIVDRVRRHTGLHQNDKHPRPLIIVVTKYDAWWPLLGERRLADPWLKATARDLHALDLPKIDAISAQVRKLLWEFTPEIVSAAEAFAQEVYYVPVSATGCSPQFDTATRTVRGMRTGDIDPMWVEVPLLMALARWSGGTVAFRSAETDPSASSAGSTSSSSPSSPSAAAREPTP